MIGTCALCQSANVELIDSHVLPRWVYRRLHNLGPVGQLIATGNGKVGYSSKQDSRHLLCRPCEDRFGDPEQYVSSLVVQPDGTFPGLTRVTSEKQAAPGVELARPTGLDVEKLTYFAVSVFWRADVAQSEPVVALGASAEPTRLYLLGGQLPPNLFLVVKLLAADEGSFATRIASAPETHNEGQYHDLLVLGMRFRLITSADVSTSRAAAEISLPHSNVVLIDRDRQTANAIAEETQTSTAYGKLAKKGM